MMKSRKLAIGLLLMLSIAVTTGSFAFWASGIVQAEDQTVSATVAIGQGQEITMTLAATSSVVGSDLIPTGYGTDGTDDTAIWTIPVTYTASTTGSDIANGDLTVSIGTPAIGGLTEAQITSMFTFTVTTNPGTLTVGAAAENVVVTVVFANEPANATEYAAVALADLTFDITLSVSPN